MEHLVSCGTSGKLWNIWEVMEHLGSYGASGKLWSIWLVDHLVGCGASSRPGDPGLSGKFKCGASGKLWIFCT